MTLSYNMKGIFLSKFDMKKGNILYWSRDCENFDDSLEFKSLPAGVHDLIDDFIIFTVKDKNTNKYYYGCCYYRQNGFDLSQNSKQLDRNLIKMFSLGVILNIELKEEMDKDAKFDEITHYYFCNLRKLLVMWLQDDSEPMDQLLNFYEDHQQPSRNHDILMNNSNNARNKLNYYWAHWWKRLGPLVFPIWRSLILKEKLLILIPSGHDFDTINSLCYILTQLSNVCAKTDRQNNSSVKSIYTIGTSDLDSMSDILNDKNGSGYIACTTDSLLAYKEEVYDKLLMINNSSDTLNDDDLNDKDKNSLNLIKLFDNRNKNILATPKDLEIFEWINENKLSEQNINTDHILNCLKIENKSWFQWFIDDIFFIFTAGYIIPKYHFQRNIFDPPTISIESNVSSREIMLTFFQQKTEAILNRISSKISHTSDATNNENTVEEAISLSPEDLNELDLDCFSEQEYEFIQKLIFVKFNKKCLINSTIRDYLQIIY